MTFYSPIDRLAQTLPRPKGTGAEFMTELSKMPGYKSQEAEDRGLQALMNLPKMERAQFMEALKSKRPVVPQTHELSGDYGGYEPHHEEYTLPGGTNYREILLQHPKGAFKGVEHHFDGTPNILASVRVKDRMVPGEMGYTLRNKTSGFKSRHHKTLEEAQASIQNYPEHFRSTLDVVPNKGPDKKILHIEELQSDWHQQGREHGYRPAGQSERLTGEPYKVDEDEYGIKWSDGSIEPDTYSENYARRIAEQGKLTGKVPDAPFKKNWHEMALKKMIHHAAANGYDAIAITPGQEQADRYGLAKHVKDLTYLKNKNGTHDLSAFSHEDVPIIEKQNLTPQDLEAHVGKELAKKILSNEGEPTKYDKNARTLSGLDLKVGGEGMKGFYDKIVPNFLNQFGKKYGAKVQLGTIAGMSFPDYLAKRNIELRNGEMFSSGFPLHSSAVKKAYEEENPIGHVLGHTFPITQAMREDVTKNGVPLYADGGPVPPLRPLSPQLTALREQMAQQSALSKAYDEAMKNVRTSQMPTFADWVASQGKAKGGKVSRKEHDANLAKFLSESKVKDRLYHATPANFNEFKPGGHNPRISGHAIWLGADPSHLPAAHHIGDPKNPKTGVQIMPVHVQVKKPMVLDDKDMLEWAQAAYAGGSKEFPELMPKEWADKVKEDYDSIIHADPHGRGDPHEVIVFHPSQIKSAIGNRGTYDTSKSDMTKAKGGRIKPVGYTKERITVSPNLDAMRYELESVKHFTKKVK